MSGRPWRTMTSGSEIRRGDCPSRDLGLLAAVNCYDGQKPWNSYRSIAASGPDVVRFVSINDRCCCGAQLGLHGDRVEPVLEDGRRANDLGQGMCPGLRGALVTGRRRGPPVRGLDVPRVELREP
nr:unnamed protein product [Digitaria exilis]